MSSGMTARPREASERTSRTSPPARRADIQGLRALAVLAVIINHMIGWPVGGFVGVDIFFVISGYLITNQLVREASTRGRVSLPRFYARRARRLLPAATVVLVTTALAGWWLLPRGRHAELGLDVLSATGYVLNWSLAAREVDYLAEDAAPSLVQHYWSLSVEEQFYVLWPLLIVAVLWATRRDRRRLLPMLTVVLALVVATSLVWSVSSTAASPQTAYFVTTTRIWQLGTGALLVLLTPLLARLPRPAAAATAWAGLTLIAVTLFTTTSATPWPGTAALLPTLGTAAVIAAGASWPRNPAARLLSHRPMLFLGAVSYGLYLWHWPALRLLAELHPDAGLMARLTVAAGSVLLAWLTLHLVENPVRHHPLLAQDHRRTLVLGAAAMAVSAGTALAVWSTAPTLEPRSAGAGDGALALVDPASWTQPQLRLVDDPASATEVVDQLVPDPAVADEDLSLAYASGCQVTTTGTEIKEGRGCWFGDPEGSTTVALVGDSKAEQWSSALHAVGLQEGWRIRGYTKSACGFVSEGRSEVCHDYNEELSVRLGQPEHAPDIVVMSLGSGYDPSMVDSTLSLLRPAIDRGARVVVLADNPLPRPRGMPEDTSVYQCLDVHRDDYGPCWSPDMGSSGNTVLRETAERLGAPFVDLNPWVCPDPQGPDGCPPVVGGTVVYRQGSHLSGSYIRSLTAVLHHELVVAGVADTPLDRISHDIPEDPPPED